MSSGQDALEDVRQVVESEQHLPCERDSIVSDSDEVHSQTLSEEEESEDECPNSAEEKDRRDGAPVFVVRDLESVRTKDDERDSVSHISDHQSEEHGKEDSDQDGRVNLLILRHRHELCRILELLHHSSVVELSRSGLESLLCLFHLVHGPAACLLDLNVDPLDHGLQLFFYTVGLLGGHPCVGDEGILAVRDPYRDLSLLDLDGQLLVGSAEEVFVFLKKIPDLFRDILHLGVGGLDLAVSRREDADRGSGSLRDLDLGESAFGEDGLDFVLVLRLHEHGHHVALLLVEGGEDLCIHSGESGGWVICNGSDHRDDAPVSGVHLEVYGYVGKKLKTLLLSV